MSGDEGEAGGGWAASGATYVAGPEEEVGPGAEGELGGTWMGKEDGSASVPGGASGGEAQWCGERGAESPRDCAG